MKALAVLPGKPNSLHLREISDHDLGEGELLCEMISIGICGTDIEISQGKYGTAPANSEYLIIGHESLGRVLEAPAGSGFAKGDLIVGFVRRPDPVPCPNCAKDEWDMCRNGLFKERGIKELHGYASERFRVSEKFSVKLDPALEKVGVLLEPTSVVAKAWEQIERIGARGCVAPSRALITGAGPVGLLAALIGVKKGLEVHVLDRTDGGPKPELVRNLGAVYHSDIDALEKSNIDFDVTLECTGAPELIQRLFFSIKADGILCLAGVSSGGRLFPTDIGALNLDIVLENEVIFGSVNANRRHYEQAVKILSEADSSWLSRLITRKVRFDEWPKAFEKGANDVKTVLVAK